jgi:DNA-binding NarL/FixJ family response regulator
MLIEMMKEKYNIIIIDDHDFYRKSLSLTINRFSFAEVIGEWQDGRDYFDSQLSKMPDIAFIDIRMPGLNGIKTTRKLCMEFPDIKVIGISMYENTLNFVKMIGAGARGLLLKSDDKYEIKKAIQAVANNEYYYSKTISTNILQNLKNKYNYINTTTL